MAERKFFPDSVTPLPEQSGLTHNGLLVNAAEAEHRDEKMTMLFSLEVPAEARAELAARVARGEVVPLDELSKDYAPAPAERQALLDWLKAQGFEVVEMSADGTSVYARATVAQIEKSLEVKMMRVTRDGLSYNAAQNAPSLPATAGRGVRAIIGLQPYRQAHKHSRKCVPAGGNRASLPLNGGAKRATKKAGAKSAKKGAGEPAAAPTTNIQNAPPYLVGEVLKAYNADGLNVTGKGQTIAILIDTFPTDADLKKFWKRNNLPVKISQIEKINVRGVPLPPPEGEETLDVSWASGVAPGAKVRIYATGSLRFVDIDRALDRIISDLPGQPGMRQLSISLGLGETFMARDEVTVENMKFTRLAAAGVNVFVSSGDAGSNPDNTGHGSTGATQAEYESSDPNVVGVGGTTLNLNATGAVASETGWTGSGGGKSVLFPRPPWQRGVGVPAGNERLVPDVSLAADPNKGAFLVLQGQAVQIGGTSWSAPVWAGFCALLNEARAHAKKGSLPFLNPLVYPLMGTACFRDIQTGNNGAFTSGPGYDLVTGIGVPNVRELINSLTK